MNIQDECIKIHSKFGMSEMANYKIQLLFDSEIEKVRKEYEEKLRWIPVEEKLPEIETEFNESIMVLVQDYNGIILLAFYNYDTKIWFSAYKVFELSVEKWRKIYV